VHSGVAGDDDELWIERESGIGDVSVNVDVGVVEEEWDRRKLHAKI